MKTILKLSLVIALLFTGVNSYAIDGGDFNLHVIRNQGKLISFSLSKVHLARVTIYETDGTPIYTEKVKGTEAGILRTFDLEEFPKGTYLLEVETGDKKVIHEINITSEKTNLSSTALSVVYKDATDTSKTRLAAL